MTLTQLAKYIEGVAARVAAGDEQLDEVEGLAVAFVQGQQHYVAEGCGDVVRALVPPASLREARGSLADALAALELCGKEETDALTPPDVAKRLGVKPATVIGWIKSGQLKASNLSKGARPRYRVQPDDLAEFLDKRQPQQPGKSRFPTRNRPSRF